MVFSFVTKCRKGRKILSQLLMEGKLLSVTLDDETVPARLYGDKLYPQSMGMPVKLTGEGQGSSLPNTFNMDLFRTSEMRDSFASTQVERSGLAAVHTDRHVKQALLYCYRKRTEEIKAFHKAKEVKKMGYEVEGVLLSRDRLNHGREFQETVVLDLDLGAMGIRTFLPVLDQYSPLSYTIAQYIHSQVSWSRELCRTPYNRFTSCWVLDSTESIRCKIKRKKYLEAAFGPIKELIYLTIS